RPRLDLVVYVITTRLLPHHQRRYYQLTSRREMVAWRKDFKKEWKKLSNHDSSTTNPHITDVTKWMCSCKYFLLSRWPMCYHLVLRVPDLRSNTSLFASVTRQEVYPFLKHPSLQDEDDSSFETSNTGGKRFLFNFILITVLFNINMLICILL